MNFEELQVLLNWKTLDQTEAHPAIQEHKKKNVDTLFVSATPAQYEIDLCQKVVQQVIRPTWLLDPITYVYPKSWSYETLLSSIWPLLKKKPYLKEYLDWYESSSIHWFN